MQINPFDETPATPRNDRTDRIWWILLWVWVGLMSLWFLEFLIIGFYVSMYAFEQWEFIDLTWWRDIIGVFGQWGEAIVMLDFISGPADYIRRILQAFE